MSPRPPTNQDIARVLDEVADLLEAQEAGPFRVGGWRRGAQAVRDHDEPIVDVLDRGGQPALQALPHIGRGLAGAIAELVTRGRLSQLDRLRGAVTPEDLFATLPGVGDVLARRLHQELGLETLEELEAAAADGRLETLDGIGPRRAAAIRDLLAQRLARRPSRRPAPTGPRPDVALLLEVDRIYRRKAKRGQLVRIAPRRFNPEHERWLPVLHTDAGGWHFTALFSNTARAHELGRTDDWVVLYYTRDDVEGQCTVVTETHGPQRGRRVVRGREAESAAARDGTTGER